MFDHLNIYTKLIINIINTIQYNMHNNVHKIIQIKFDKICYHVYIIYLYDVIKCQKLYHIIIYLYFVYNIHRKMYIILFFTM